MKVDSIVFTNSIPEVKFDGKVIQVDLGVVIIELSRLEAESLIQHIYFALNPDREIILSLEKRR